MNLKISLPNWCFEKTRLHSSKDKYLGGMGKIFQRMGKVYEEISMKKWSR